MIRTKVMRVKYRKKGPEMDNQAGSRKRSCIEVVEPGTSRAVKKGAEMANQAGSKKICCREVAAVVEPGTSQAVEKGADMAN